MEVLSKEKNIIDVCGKNRHFGSPETFLTPEKLEEFFESQEWLVEENIGAIQKINKDFFEKKIHVLDIGCSVGAYSFGIRKYAAHVVGIDVEEGAIESANAYKNYKNYSNVDFIVDDGIHLGKIKEKYIGYFDLVVLKQTIEHISSLENLEIMLKNISIVLREGGAILIEAPNYIFPHEPHLNILIPPLCPKFLIKIIGRALGKLKDEHNRHIVETLNIVSTKNVEKVLKKQGFSFVNLYEQVKLRDILFGGKPLSERFKFIEKFIKVGRKTGVNNILYETISWLDFYPSMSYLAIKK